MNLCCKLVELHYMHSFHPHPDRYILMKTCSHSLWNNQRKSVSLRRFDWLYFQIVILKVALAVTDFSVYIKQHCSIVAWPWLWLQNQCWLHLLTCQHEQMLSQASCTREEIAAFTWHSQICKFPFGHKFHKLSKHWI